MSFEKHTVLELKDWTGPREKVGSGSSSKMKEAKATKPSYVAGAAVPGPSLLQGWQDEGGKGHPSQGPPSSTTGSTTERVTKSNFLLRRFVH
jgi:hypothetical protein